jgi:hypothetical protein
MFFLHNINAGGRLRPGQSRWRSSEVPGGARRSRTDDILLAKQALYQLSYGPVPEERLKAQESCRRPVTRQ